jgi:hypothetical protein
MSEEPGTQPFIRLKTPEEVRAMVEAREQETAPSGSPDPHGADHHPGSPDPGCSPDTEVED